MQSFPTFQFLKSRKLHCLFSKIHILVHIEISETGSGITFKETFCAGNTDIGWDLPDFKHLRLLRFAQLKTFKGLIRCYDIYKTSVENVSFQIRTFTNIYQRPKSIFLDSNAFSISLQNIGLKSLHGIAVKCILLFEKICQINELMCRACEQPAECRTSKCLFDTAKRLLLSISNSVHLYKTSYALYTFNYLTTHVSGGICTVYILNNDFVKYGARFCYLKILAYSCRL